MEGSAGWLGHAAAVCVCVGLVSSAYGVVAPPPTTGPLLGVGGEPPTQFGTEHLDNPVMVGTENDPIEIYMDPDGDDWLKDFGINVGPTGIEPGQPVSVQEHISVGWVTDVPPIALTDWHESIVGGENADDFVWGGGEITVSQGQGDEAESQTAQGIVSDDGKTIDFFFDEFWPEVNNPVDLVIDKELVWVGDGVPVTTGENPVNMKNVQIQQNPTPEPGSLLVLGGLGAALLGRRLR